MKFITCYLILIIASVNASAGLAKKYAIDGVVSSFDADVVTIVSDGKTVVLKRDVFNAQRLSAGKRVHVSIADQDIVPTSKQKKSSN